MSGIIYVIKHGLMWRDAPRSYGPHKTIYNRFIRWSRLGVFKSIFAEQACKAREPDAIMFDATHLKTHGTAARLFKRGAVPRCIGRTNGGLNSKLYAVCDGLGCPSILLLTECQMSNYKGAVLLFSSLPKAKVLLGDMGYDSDWFRAVLDSQGITACIPPKANRKVLYHNDKALHRQRHKIENMFGRIKECGRVATRYDRCARTFMSAISIAATICYWF